MKKNDKQAAKLFMVWQEADASQYFNQYTTIEDAVSSEGDNCEVWVAEPKYLGTFCRDVRVVKSKRKAK